MAGFPAKLKNFNVFGNGESWLGQVGEITPPKLTRKVEQWRGGSMLGEVDIDLGLEKLELELKIGGLLLGALRMFGLVGIAGAQLRFVGAYQDDQSGEVMALEIVTRGRMTEIDLGTGKAGDNTEHTYKLSATYMKWTVNGRVEAEVDLLNNIFIVDGVDLTAQIRIALGQ